jgi:transposase-like protein
MLKDRSMSIREIETALAGKGLRVAYSTIHSWMKRSVARGDFKRKSAKYKWQEAKDQHTA